MRRFEDLDIIIPVSIELDWPEKQEIIDCIREQHEKYGFTRFALSAPGAGWRSFGYPPKEHFISLARLFCEVRDALKPDGICCGWWDTLTLKSGPCADFTRITRSDGSGSPFANCPLDPAFRRRFSEDVALFASIAKPAFIFFEDDYAINAASDGKGCFCEHHLKAFAEREQRDFTREELSALLDENTPEAEALNRRWRALMRDSLVGLSQEVRRAVDRETPEIPIGYMQPGCCDVDGDVTEAVSRALAGPAHTPFSRLYGVTYCGFNSKSLADILFHAIYCRQHLPEDFICYHESDTFPHTRFYSSAAQMIALMSVIYSHGFDGSTFQTQQLLDDPNEEKVYGKAFAKERRRLNVLSQTSKQCVQHGVTIPFDPFYNRYHGYFNPLWLHSVSVFGIPFTTLPGNVAFWDAVTARTSSREAVLSALSGGLFLDGSAAKALIKRGFGEYLGVTIGDEDTADPPLRFDLGAREVIREPFAEYSKGKNMPSAHMFSSGNGKLYRMTVTDPRCEVISDLCTFRREAVCPAMTRFVNRLGGHIVVYGTTLENNSSQSLFNYRRQRLFQKLLCWCSDEYAFVKDDADICLVMNRAKDPARSGFCGMLTAVNTSEDPLDELHLHLPPEWRNEERSFRLLSIDGIWEDAETLRTEDGITLRCGITPLSPVVLLIL